MIELDHDHEHAHGHDEHQHGHGVEHAHKDHSDHAHKDPNKKKDKSLKKAKSHDHGHDHDHEHHGHHDEESLIAKPKENNSSAAKTAAFAVIGFLTLVYCVAELAAAIYLDVSLTLLSDGFHNLSDVVSLYIAYWAQKAAKRDLSDTMSYGWVRTEILGGLTNGCFLLALSLYVALEAIPRFIEPSSIREGGEIIFIIVAGAGLALNTLGTVVLGCVGMSHAHSHSHGHGHGHGHGHKDKKGINGEKPHKEKKDKKKKKQFKMDLNVGAVFIHYLGDAVSSLFVLGTGFLLKFEHASWTKYVDPISSLLIVALIIATTVPLVKRCSLILLQSVPSDLDVDSLRRDIAGVASVVNIHDLHVWQLVDGVIIASAHLACEEGCDFGELVYTVKKIFHSYGIHSTAIQPEFVSNRNNNAFCAQNCVEECEADWCCKKPAESSKLLGEQYGTKIPI